MYYLIAGEQIREIYLQTTFSALGNHRYNILMMQFFVLKNVHYYF